MIRRVRRYGREARGNEEREKREDREREQRGDRERDKKTEEKEGPRDPPLLEFLDPTLCFSHCFFKSSGYDKLELKHQNLFLQAYRKHYLKNMSWCETECKKIVPLVKQNVMKLEVFILGRQRIDQKRKKGWGEGEERGLRKGAERG